MAISDEHASHSGRVAVAFVILERNLDPVDISRVIGVLPTACARRDEQRHNGNGEVVGTWNEGWWKLSTAEHIDSEDINDHFRYLIAVLRPHAQALHVACPDAETFFDVLWEASALRPGTGPMLDPDCIEGASELGGGIGFDIYQLDDEDR